MHLPDSLFCIYFLFRSPWSLKSLVLVFSSKAQNFDPFTNTGLKIVLRNRILSQFSIIRFFLSRYYHLPHRIFMLRFSRMSANNVVVNWTLPSWSTGIFIRMSFLYAKRLGHLLPKPNGGSMFLSISYISV